MFNGSCRKLTGEHGSPRLTAQKAYASPTQLWMSPGTGIPPSPFRNETAAHGVETLTEKVKVRTLPKMLMRAHGCCGLPIPVDSKTRYRAVGIYIPGP
jgi:hypothetical protein